MPRPQLPDLTLTGLTYGEAEVPRDLRRWLYRGATRTPARLVDAQIKEGVFGPPVLGRVELVHQIHDVLSNYIGRGGSRSTVFSYIEKATLFIRWAEESNHELTLYSAEEIYRYWCDWLLHRARIKKEISEKTAYGYGSVVGWIVDRALKRTSPIVWTTRLRAPPHGSRAVSVQSDKQNLKETFAFGHFLLDLADGLGVDTIWGPIPARISLRNGTQLEEWCGRAPKLSESTTSNAKRWDRQNSRISAERLANRESEKTFRTRYPLINLRIQVEMFMLMGQPGINLAQINQLRMDQWRYKSSTNGYEVRTYKNRRLGAVVFEIYSEYRSIFERYLRWRTAIFPNDPHGLLFPLLDKRGIPSQRHTTKAPDFDRLQSACKRAGVTYIPTSALRNTNANWMLRRTQDPQLTADEKQHAVKTLLDVYEKPSLQRAMVQVNKFWSKHDPEQIAAGPGACAGKTPAPVVEKPAMAPMPDCVTPSGCFFCIHHRDIDNFDHAWSLVSFRLMKSFELSKYIASPIANTTTLLPPDIVINRITAKLNDISTSEDHRKGWVEEALLRIEEGRYHPSWADMIESV